MRGPDLGLHGEGDLPGVSGDGFDALDDGCDAVDCIEDLSALLLFIVHKL